MARNISLDILKIIMAIMVVGLHSHFLHDITPLGNYLTVNGLFRIAVPVFLIINGFFFYSTIKSDNIKKWFKRIALLYLFWMLFYSYSWVMKGDLDIYKISQIVIFGHKHLWYLPATIGAAAIIYLLRNQSSKILLILSILLFLTGAAIQYIGNYHLISNVNIDKTFNDLWIYRNFLFFGFPFFCIGYIIKKHELHKKLRTDYLSISVLLGLVFLISESYFNSTRISEGFDIYISLLILCPLIFLLALSFKISGNSKSLSMYATGIYFIHPFLISVVIRVVDIKETMLAIVVTILAALITVILIKINDKLKFIL